MSPFLYKNSLLRFQQVLFYLLVLFLPVQLSLHFWPDWSFVSGIRVDYLSPTIYLTDFVVIAFLLTSVFGKHVKRHFFANRYFYFGLFFLALINSFFAIRPVVAFFGWFKYVEVLLLGIFLSWKPDYFKSSNFHKLLLFTVVYVSLIGIAQYLNSGSLGGAFYYLGERTFNIYTPGIAKGFLLGREMLRPYSILPHPNVLAGYVGLTTLLLYVLTKWSLITRLSVIFTIIILVLTQSTSAVVGLVLAVAFLRVSKILPVAKAKRIFITFVLVVLLVTFITLVFSGQISKYFSDESLIKRLDLLSSTFLTLSQGKNLFTGTGLNNFIIGLEKYWAAPSLYSWLQPVHNIFLLLLSELGILGFVFTGFFASRLLNWISKKEQVINLSLVIFVFAVGLVDHYWLTLQQPLLLIAVSFGYTVSVIEERTK